MRPPLGLGIFATLLAAGACNALIGLEQADGAGGAGGAGGASVKAASVGALISTTSQASTGASAASSNVQSSALASSSSGSGASSGGGAGAGSSTSATAASSSSGSSGDDCSSCTTQQCTNGDCCAMECPMGFGLALGYALQRCGCMSGKPCYAQCSSLCGQPVDPKSACGGCLSMELLEVGDECAFEALQLDCLGDASCNAFGQCDENCAED